MAASGQTDAAIGYAVANLAADNQTRAAWEERARHVGATLGPMIEAQFRSAPCRGRSSDPPPLDARTVRRRVAAGRKAFSVVLPADRAAAGRAAQAAVQRAERAWIAQDDRCQQIVKMKRPPERDADVLRLTAAVWRAAVEAPPPWVEQDVSMVAAALERARDLDDRAARLAEGSRQRQQMWKDWGVTGYNRRHNEPWRDPTYQQVEKLLDLWRHPGAL